MAQVRKARTIPGFTQTQSAALFREFTQRDAVTTQLAQRDTSTEVFTRNVAARAGQFLRCTPDERGMSVVLPPPDETVPGDRVTISLESPVGELAVVCVPNQSEGRLRTGTVNGQTRATFTVDGVIELVSNGDDEWSTAAEHPRESAALSADTFDLALGEPFVTWGASAELTNERQAIASTEITPSVSVASVISWVLNTASVAFSKLADLAGLSVLGRAASSSGVMAAITATGPEQVLRSDPTGTSIGFASLLSTQHLVTIAAGTFSPYLLPTGFRHGDTLAVTLTGNVTLNGIRFADDSSPPEGFIMYVALRDQSGGSAPGWFLDVVDGGMVTDGLFRTPGQVQGTVPGPSYRMQSEEEGSAWVMVAPVGFASAWRLLAGTAAQAITGDITVSAGNGSTRTAAITADVIVNADVNSAAAIAQTKLGATTGFSVKASGASATTSAEPIVTYSASANMSAERVTTSSTTVTVSTSVASQIEFQRAALTGDVTASANSNATTIASDAVTNAKMADMAAATVKLRALGAGTGDPIDGTASQLNAIVGSTNLAMGTNYVGWGTSPGSVGTTQQIRSDGALAVAGNSDLSITVDGIVQLTSTAASFVMQAGGTGNVQATSGSTGAVIFTAGTAGLAMVTTGTTFLLQPASGAAVQFPRGFIDLTEASASTPTVSAAHSLIWAKNDAPNRLMSTDDGNTDHVICYKEQADIVAGLGGPESITGTTEQEQIDSIVAAGVAMGLWTDDR